MYEFPRDITDGSKDCGQTGNGCKGRLRLSVTKSVRLPVVVGRHWWVSNPTTRNCIFLLDTTRDSPQNSRNFSFSFRSRGPEGNSASFQREETCSICLVGQCNALIRNAKHAATGCGPPMPEENSAATVIYRFTMCRRRWARACGCVLARWAVTVRCGVPQDASRRSHPGEDSRANEGTW